jgi:uncharacterized protein (TIGR03435 family)
MRLTLFFFGSLAWAQTFEVASIRPAERLTPQEVRSFQTGMKITTGQAVFRYRSLRDLIALVYAVEPFQLVEDQALAAGAFDVVAKLPDGATRAQVPAMLRSLLEERFRLKAHREKREDAVYFLRQANAGHKMNDALPAQTQEIDPADGFEMPLSIRSHGMKMTPLGANPSDGMLRQWERLTMSDFAKHLSPLLGRPVVDDTGLRGAYQVTYEVSVQDIMQGMVSSGNMSALALATPPGEAAEPASSSIFTSLKKLGLTLDKGRANVEKVIVDSVLTGCGKMPSFP